MVWHESYITDIIAGHRRTRIERTDTAPWGGLFLGSKNWRVARAADCYLHETSALTKPRSNSAESAVLIVRASSAVCARVFGAAMVLVKVADRGEGRGRPQLAAAEAASLTARRYQS
jgi:hypothetical protein